MLGSGWEEGGWAALPAARAPLQGVEPLPSPANCHTLLFADIFTSRVSNFLRYTPFEVGACLLFMAACLPGCAATLLLGSLLL